MIGSAVSFTYAAISDAVADTLASSSTYEQKVTLLVAARRRTPRESRGRCSSLAPQRVVDVEGVVAGLVDLEHARPDLLERELPYLLAPLTLLVCQPPHRSPSVDPPCPQARAGWLRCAAPDRQAERACDGLGPGPHPCVRRAGRDRLTPVEPAREHRGRQLGALERVRVAGAGNQRRARRRGSAPPAGGRSRSEPSHRARRASRASAPGSGPRRDDRVVVDRRPQVRRDRPGASRGVRRSAAAARVCAPAARAGTRARRASLRATARPARPARRVAAAPSALSSPQRRPDGARAARRRAAQHQPAHPLGDGEWPAPGRSSRPSRRRRRARSSMPSASSRRTASCGELRHRGRPQRGIGAARAAIVVADALEARLVELEHRVEDGRADGEAGDQQQRLAARRCARTRAAGA